MQKDEHPITRKDEGNREWRNWQTGQRIQHIQKPRGKNLGKHAVSEKYRHESEEERRDQ